MKFFLDTANVDEIRKANDMGVICGVTTNPSLIAKEGRDFTQVVAEIASIVDGPISGEVKATTTDAEGMTAETDVYGSRRPLSDQILLRITLLLGSITYLGKEEQNNKKLEITKD
jgi:hypothetical protein